MKERPILFSGPMVRAILDGRKTQTRRIVMPQPPSDFERAEAWLSSPVMGWTAASSPSGPWHRVRSPYGTIGERLWVREAWRVDITHDGKPPRSVPRSARVAYEAGEGDRLARPGRYRHARFMPRWASRLTLEVVNVRVERLQAITEDDARAEGVNGTEAATAKQDTVDVHDMTPHRAAFACLWESINADTAPWASNPWVWVVEFARVKEPGHG